MQENARRVAFMRLERAMEQSFVQFLFVILQRKELDSALKCLVCKQSIKNIDQLFRRPNKTRK